MVVCKHLICLQLKCALYMTVFPVFILKVYLALAVAEAGSKDRCDQSQLSIFSIFTFIILINGKLWLGKSVLVCWLFMFFILVVLRDLKEDKNICMRILIKLSLRFRISKIFLDFAGSIRI